MAGRRISNLGSPDRDSDAATRPTVSQSTQDVLNTAMGLFLKLDGTSWRKADISSNNFALKNIASPTEAGDAATKMYVHELIRSANGVVRRYHFKLRFRLPDDIPGVNMLTWHLANTGGRFPTQPGWLFVKLTPINTADFFAIDNVEADANWLRLRVALNHTSGHDLLGGFKVKGSQKVNMQVL